MNSITASNKRKNFKNMFYSPKGNREAYTEPHSKVVSQAQTKDNSPRQVHVKTIGGHHPQIRSTKPPSQIKSKAIYSTKDSYQPYKGHELDGNSFLEESYVKSNHAKEMSFESSNQFSQTGTPIQYNAKAPKSKFPGYPHTTGMPSKVNSQVPSPRVS
jgi:hypothetical protein